MLLLFVIWPMSLSLNDLFVVWPMNLSYTMVYLLGHISHLVGVYFYIRKIAHNQFKIMGGMYTVKTSTKTSMRNRLAWAQQISLVL